MPLMLTVRLVLNITHTLLPVTPPIALQYTREGEIPWCSLWCQAFCQNTEKNDALYIENSVDINTKEVY
jgi:hypothetical protein